MIPIGEVGLELLIGFGAALFFANLWVLLRPVMARWTGAPAPPPRRRSLGMVAFGMAAGLGVAIWATVSLIALF